MRWIEAVIVVLTGTIGVCYFIEIFVLPQTTLVNRRFRLFVAENSRSAFRAFTERVFASQSRECCEAMLLREAKTPFYARVEARSSDNGRSVAPWWWTSLSANGRKRKSRSKPTFSNASVSHSL